MPTFYFYTPCEHLAIHFPLIFKKATIEMCENALRTGRNFLDHHSEHHPVSTVYSQLLLLTFPIFFLWARMHRRKHSFLPNAAMVLSNCCSKNYVFFIHTKVNYSVKFSCLGRIVELFPWRHTWGKHYIALKKIPKDRIQAYLTCKMD